MDSLQQHGVRDTQYVKWLNSLAYSYWNQNPRKTDSLGKVALALSEELDYVPGQCRSYNQMSIGQWMLGDYPLAFEYASRQLKIAEDHSYREEVISAYSMMALITEDQGLIERALAYHHLVLEYRKSEKDSVNLAKTLNNLGSVYWQLEKPDTCLLLFQEAYEIREAIGDKRGMRESLSNIGYILNETGKPREAMPLIKKSLYIAREMEDLNGIINVSENLGNIYVNLNHLDSAEQVYLEALALAQEMGVNKRVIDIKEQLAGLYELEKNYEKAFTYLNEYWTLKDSIEGQESADKLSRLEADYESERQKNEIIRLQQQNQSTRIWNRIYALQAIAAVILALLIFYFYRYRQRKNEELLQAKDAQTRQLEEINQMKSRFLANVSHELRTPLTLIQGPVEQLLATNQGEPEKQQLQWIHHNSRKLLKMINQLLDLSRIEAGKLDLKASQQDLVQFCRYICSAFESLARQKKVNLNFVPQSDHLFVYFDSEKLEQVLNNLLFNALKFTHEGFVSLKIEALIERDKAFAKISVADSGIGIHEEQLPYIFDRFYQAHQGEPYVLEGTGIGLALGKELIELHSGKLEVASELGKGTQFSIYLPLGCSHLAEDEIIIASGVHPSAEVQALDPQMPPEQEAGGSRDHSPLLLLIDDNPDMMDYIRFNLINEYRILTAKNGEEGLELARREIPDLILSDVMMPGMNGFELCTQLKQDIKTDHIPVILLTARSGEEFKIRGLKVQADDFLQKPFNREELVIRIQNLIKSRSRLRQRFAEQTIFQNADANPNEQENLFLKQLKQAIEDNISEPQFDVNTLCKLMGMSKSQLNRKLKAVLNKSPNQFIRSYRLGKARFLIKSTEATLSEIAYDVGFSSPAYFSKCFHDEFGFPPSSLTE